MYTIKRLIATIKKATKILVRTIDSIDAGTLPVAIATHQPLALTF